jgi:hypothetical protein
VYLIGVYFTDINFVDIYFISVYLRGVRLIGVHLIEFTYRSYLPKLPTPSHPGPINYDEFLVITTSAYTLRDRVTLKDKIHTRLVAEET